MGERNIEEEHYLNVLKDIYMNGDKRKTRNSVTKSKFGVRMVFNLRNGRIPILTTKKMAIKTVIRELLWFISGKTDNEILKNQGVHIWDGNSSKEYLDSIGLSDREENDVGPVYGFQWRHWGAKYKTCKDNYDDQGIDQLQECIESIKNTPYSRRMVVSAWNVSNIREMALPPCHAFFQWYVSSSNELSLQLYQRSGDMFLGVPFNIMSYSLLIYMVAHLTNKKPGKFIHIIGDAHVYDNHYDAIEEQIKRKPYLFPNIEIKTIVEDIDSFKLEDIEIKNYCCHDKISASMTV